MNALLAHFAGRVAAEGPLGVDAYMADALGHPQFGYYATRDPFGSDGDFTTAPEVSQMFGELIGLWCAAMWMSQGRPTSIRLVELGPGRGTLMADILRAARSVDGFLAAVDVHLIETSPVLRERQRRNLSTVPVPLAWHMSFDEVPGGPILVVANEFLDALPIRQFRRTADGWCERRVDYRDGALAWIDVPNAPPEPLQAPANAIVEIAPARDALVTAVAARIEDCGGAALFIDYGHLESAPGDTLQAVKDHRFHDVLADPGEADVTSHVDFARLVGVARAAGAAVHGPITQGAFLRALGIETRAGMLARDASRRDAAEVRAALRRLTHADEMGALFKAVALSSPGALPPEGFGG